MSKYIKLAGFALIVMITLVNCKRDEFQFGDIKTPTNVAVSTAIEGVNTANPNGNGTGKIGITATATNAITYKILYGNGDS
ncbi:MAG: glucan endo-1,3-beta-D-glucosidase, partial [Pedobacter sp.]